jgi:pimeloyl-ACP methyl ester carboxylesterase
MRAALRTCLIAAVAALALFGPVPARAADPLAELVSYRAADNVPLNGLLWTAPRPTKSIAILVPGFYGSMIGGHDYVPMARELGLQGYSFMTINMRTASDFTDPRIEDAIPDIAAAVGFAKARGYEQVVIMGTSLGGPRSMLYMAEARDPAVVAYVLIAAIMSPYEEGQYRLTPEGRERDEAVLRQARQLVAAGKPMEVVTYENWFAGRPVRMTARGYLNAWGSRDDTGISTPLRGPKITVPTAVFHGTKDEISLPPNAEAIYASLTHAPKRELIWVEGATHYLQPGWIAEEYAKRISTWIGANAPAR